MMKVLLTIVLLVTTAGTALADIRQCKISSGSVRRATCSRYTGSAVVLEGGVYKECKISSGSVRRATCSRYTGSAVVWEGGSYKECKISSGSIRRATCSRFTGTAEVNE